MSSALEYECWLPLLGLPLLVRTNSRALNEILEIERPLGNWVSLPSEQIDSSSTIQIDVLIEEPEEHVDGMRLFRHGQTTLAGDGSRLLMAQAERGYGLACLSSNTLDDAVAAIWDLAMLLAHGCGRLPISAAALERDGRVVLLMGVDLKTLIQICLGRGLRLLARRTVHVSTAKGLQIWGDGVGGDLLYCAGPATLCLVERGAGRASQITPLPTSAVDGLGDAVVAVRASYWLRAGADLEMAAALVEHVA